VHLAALTSDPNQYNNIYIIIYIYMIYIYSIISSGVPMTYDVLRRDRYEKNIKLYWYAGSVNGRNLCLGDV
jgi:hypothetical protein